MGVTYIGVPPIYRVPYVDFNVYICIYVGVPLNRRTFILGIPDIRVSLYRGLPIKGDRYTGGLNIRIGDVLYRGIPI